MEDFSLKQLDELNQKLENWLYAKKLIRPKKIVPYFESHMGDYIQEFLLNHGSGMPLEKALRKTRTKDAILLKELSVCQNAVEAFNRFAVLVERKEVWRFVRLINQLHYSGSKSSLEALERFHDELWHSKLSRAKKKSEKISVQLTFLLMFSLISVIIVVIAPVMMIL